MPGTVARIAADRIHMAVLGDKHNRRVAWGARRGVRSQAQEDMACIVDTVPVVLLLPWEGIVGSRAPSPTLAEPPGAGIPQPQHRPARSSPSSTTVKSPTHMSASPRANGRTGSPLGGSCQVEIQSGLFHVVLTL